MISSYDRITGIMPVKNWVALNGLLLLIILVHSIFRDVQLDNRVTGDLRNRVIGARLQKDGRLPYFYYWKQEDGIRFYDIHNKNKSSAGVSDITASPFFHQLLYPICDLDQLTISKIWLSFQYLLIAAMIWMACRMTMDRGKQWLMINSGIFFMTTEAWKSVIVNGQLYIFCAFLMMGVICGILINKKTGSLLAGIFMAAWILNRPFGLVVLLPILLMYKTQRLFLLSTLAGLVLYGLFVFSSSFEIALWQNYMQGMQLHAINHQAAGSKNVLTTINKPAFKQMEGIDFEEVYKYTAAHPIAVYSENGNFFVFYWELTHKKISMAWLNTLSFSTVSCLLGIFYLRYKKRKPQPLQVLFFAFTLYMIMEIFIPIYRHQYNTVQWIPMVLIAPLISVERNKLFFLLLGLGLFLNIMNMTWIPMRHTLGELAWLAAMLLISFSQVEKINVSGEQTPVHPLPEQ